MKTRPESLDSIPGIGKALSRKLNAIGISGVSDLRSTKSEQLFRKLEKALGTHVDRCVLYTFRCAVYFANHEKHDPAKLKWWKWKDNPFHDRTGENWQEQGRRAGKRARRLNATFGEGRRTK